MKKLILLFLLLSTFAYSQTHYYIKQKDYKVHQFHGTEACYDSIMASFPFSPMFCSFFDWACSFNGVTYEPGNIMAYSETDFRPKFYVTWDDFNSELTSDIQKQYTPYKDNINGYLTSNDIKKQETFSGTTNSSGNYSVTFSVAYSVAPNIQANIVGGSNTNLIKITSVSTTGFTVNVVNRTDVVGLLPSYSNVNGAAVDVIITEK